MDRHFLYSPVLCIWPDNRHLVLPLRQEHMGTSFSHPESGPTEVPGKKSFSFGARCLHRIFLENFDYEYWEHAFSLFVLISC
jgi:hypothetical protein